MREQRATTPGSPAGVLQRLYARGGVVFVRRALFAQLAMGLVVGLVGALLSLLFAPSLSLADMAIIIALSELIYGVDGSLAAGPIKQGLAPLEHWAEAPSESTGRRAWEAL